MEKTKATFFIHQQGFSLIELMVTLAISAVVATLSVHAFLTVHTEGKAAVQKSENAVTFSVFHKIINHDLSQSGQFSVGTLFLQAHLPSSGTNRNFFDYYKHYPVGLLSEAQQTRVLTFFNTDSSNSYIYFLQPFSGEKNIDIPITNAKYLYNYNTSDNLFVAKSKSAAFEGQSKIKLKIPNSGPIKLRDNMWKPNHLMLFYVPLYFGSNPITSKNPVRLYSYLGVVTSTGISFNNTFVGNLLTKTSPVYGDNTSIDTFKKVIEHAPLVGGNKFQLRMTRVQWLSYFFQTSRVSTKGGKLYRCVITQKVVNIKNYCTPSTGTLILDNIKNISFQRDVDSADIKVIVNMIK